ncbi:MAG: hypothetical protein M3478_16000, partial [Planctomycetota bacterium]|nr:hypothetical protein [Planctomycetota bacterium]
MSLKKSDIVDYASTARPERSRGAWWPTLRSNGPVPLILLVIVLLGTFVESRTFGAYNQRIVMLIGFNVVLAVSLQLINGFSGQFSLGHAGFMAVGAYMAAYPALEFKDPIAGPGNILLFYLVLALVVGVACAVLYGVFLLLRMTRR